MKAIKNAAQNASDNSDTISNDSKSSNSDIINHSAIAKISHNAKKTPFKKTLSKRRVKINSYAKSNIAKMEKLMISEKSL